MPASVASIKRTYPTGQVFYHAEVWLDESDLNQIMEPDAEPYVRLTFKFLDLRGGRTDNYLRGNWSGRYYPESDRFDPPLVWQPVKKPIKLLNKRKLKAFLRKSVPALFGTATARR
jgi:hypothetical protein